MLTKSRAVATEVAMSTARCTVALVADLVSAVSAMIFFRPGPLGAVLGLRKSVNRYAPSIYPSTVAPRSSAASASLLTMPSDSPYSVAEASSTASSSVEYDTTDATGPKTSSQ